MCFKIKKMESNTQRGETTEPDDFLLFIEKRGGGVLPRLERWLRDHGDCVRAAAPSRFLLSHPYPLALIL